MAGLSYPPFRASTQLVRASENNPWLKQGAKGGGVGVMQGALMDLGYPMPITLAKWGRPDGLFGSETYRTVQRFQGDHKLSVDGIAGRMTIHALDTLKAGGAPA